MVTGRDAWLLIGLLWLCYLLVQIGLLLTLRSHLFVWGVERALLLNALVVGFVLLLPTLLVGLRKGWKLRTAFRFRSASWKVIVATLFGTLGLGLAASQVLLWLMQWLAQMEGLPQSRYMELLQATTRTLSPTLLLLATLLPALPEELVFRGVVQQGFERRYSPVVAIVITGVVFALFHMDPLQAIIVLPIALFWGWVVWRAQSVLPSLIAHAVQNGVTALSLLESSTLAEGSVASLPLAASPQWGAAVGGLLLWAVMCVVLNRILPVRGDRNGADRILAHQTGVANRDSGSRCVGPDECSGPEG